MTGTVYLVGAGPGDPGLLTLRAAELLARADVLVYDALVSPAIVERAARAERVYVGKRGGEHTRTQDEINRLLVELAGRFHTVVRLKGGDPFVFGRGGEEALVLREAGVPFEVVPGITSGVAGPAYAGIPVTQRGVTSSVALVTGHEDPTKDDTDLDWAHLARGVGTLVFYMGVGKMADNFRRLMEGGRSPDTPAAAVESGTYPRQRTVAGTLATLPALVREAGIGAPSVVVVGEVVALREQLAWYDRRPLSGRRIVVTRARAQASGFAAELEALGAEVIQFPTIRIEAAPDAGALRDAAAGVGGFDWVVFTSTNGVEHFWSALAGAGLDARALAGVRVCALGPATAAELAARGIRADLVPDEYVAEATVEALAAAADLHGARILLPRAEVARAVLPDSLRERGAEVVEVAAYRTVQDGAGADEVRRRIAAGEVDLVTFTASSTVRSFAELVGTDTGGASVASIGPITSGTLRELGMRVDVEAKEYTIPGLLAAIRGFWGS
ncbi:MAG TPA: uroporphyrinogen-III C-methyltransferase [Longimicrobium sp.]|jgi:uroporphyrinogen III methyltransferase/synthase